MVDKTSYMFVTGPEVIKAVTHEQVSKEELGGSITHSEKSGVAQFKCTSEDECFERVRELLWYIPSSNFKTQSRINTSDSVYRDNIKIKDIIPDNPKRPYDMREVILDIVDDGHFLEIHKDYAKNIIVGFASIGGIKIGVVANQPSVLAGGLDIDSSRKGSSLLFAFAMPLIFPFLP